MTNIEEAVLAIDKQFGEGYAKRNPNLVGSVIQASAMDSNTEVIAAQMEKLSSNLNEIAYQLEIKRIV